MNEIDRSSKNAEFHKVMLELKDERIQIQENTIAIQNRTIWIQTSALTIITIINLVRLFF